MIEPDEGTIRHHVESSGKLMFTVIAVALAVVISISIFAAVLLIQAGRQEAADCRGLASLRDDNRSMWVATFDYFVESEDVQGLRTILDARLPRLVCDGTTLIPLAEP